MSNTTEFQFDFTADQLKLFLTGNANYMQWYQALCEFLPQHDIASKLRVAAFLAQTHHESAGFKFLSENLNYRWESLRRVWPRHFPTDQIAKEYAHKPERIANRAYANRMGNSDEASGDGWRYRGQGLIQLTGKNNQARFATDTGMSLDQVPDYLGTFSGAVHSACWFWQENNLNLWADRGDVDGISDLINLGRKTDTQGDAHGFADRKFQYERILRIFDVQGLAESDSDVLSVGSRGDRVREMQQALGVTADGDFGPGTERALKNWQQAQGLVADGVAGPVTLGKLLGNN